MKAEVLVLCLIVVKIAIAKGDPLVQLPNGLILGLEKVTYANTVYSSFEKIPYAAPPVGLLRFRAPQPAQNWTGILHATILDATCHQLGYNLPTDSEDCLFLNVYTPQLPTDNDNVSLPVMFSIHGGAFSNGWITGAYPDFGVDNGVVLVTINYRLGLFGFLSTQDEVIPGNNGLKDQKLALQWTYDNIHLFGGDPNKITILGHSAGAGSVAYQLLNQDSNGLFRAAIMQSGTFLSPWAYQRRARSIAFATAAEAGFGPSNDSSALLEFLQSLSSEELDAAADQYLAKNLAPWGYDFIQGLTYCPVIEVHNADAFVTEKMYGLLRSGNILKVPTMMGFTSEESVAYFPDPNVFQVTAERWDADPGHLVPDSMQITDPEEHQQMALKIRDIYTEGEPWSTRLGDGIRWFSDHSFSRGIAKHAELYSSFAATYFYQFSYDGQIGGSTVHYDGAGSVGHGSEGLYLSCPENVCPFASYPSDLLTSKRMIKMWTDFAKYMNPTPEPVELLQNIIWPALSVENGDFLYLDINENLEVKNHPKEEAIRAWEEVYSSLNFTDFDTY